MKVPGLPQKDLGSGVKVEQLIPTGNMELDRPRLMAKAALLMIPRLESRLLFPRLLPRRLLQLVTVEKKEEYPRVPPVPVMQD